MLLGQGRRSHFWVTKSKESYRAEKYEDTLCDKGNVFLCQFALQD